MLNCIHFQDNHCFKIKRFNQVGLARQAMKNISTMYKLWMNCGQKAPQEAPNEFISNYDLNTDPFFNCIQI